MHWSNENFFPGQISASIVTFVPFHESASSVQHPSSYSCVLRFSSSLPIVFLPHIPSLLSPYLSLPLSVSVSLTLLFSPTHCLLRFFSNYSLCLSLAVSVSFSHFLPLSVCLAISPTFSLCLSLSLMHPTNP